MGLSFSIASFFSFSIQPNHAYKYMCKYIQPKVCGQLIIPPIFGSSPNLNAPLRHLCTKDKLEVLKCPAANPDLHLLYPVAHHLRINCAKKFEMSVLLVEKTGGAVNWRAWNFFTSAL